MIDLTPLDVRKKKGDFRRGMRGYDPEEVNAFLDLVVDRLEELVRENVSLKSQAADLHERVQALGSRERAVNEALVTAQELRAEIKEEAKRQADQLRKEAESDAAMRLQEAEAEIRKMRTQAESDIEKAAKVAEKRMEELTASLQELNRVRARFLNTFRALLEHELDNLAVIEARTPLEESQAGAESATEGDSEDGPEAELAEEAEVAAGKAQGQQETQASEGGQEKKRVSKD